MKVMARISLESLQIAYEALQTSEENNRDFLLGKMDEETCTDIGKLLKFWDELAKDAEEYSSKDYPKIANEINLLQNDVRNQIELLSAIKEIGDEIGIGEQINC